jgi:hypothetical protein|tara:strand:- start:1405 stop:2055 length:651 start_codon:yes stop_codon:yes gene_type:complete
MELLDGWLHDAAADLVHPSRGVPTTRPFAFECESEAVTAAEHVWEPSTRAAGARERRAMVHACRALRIQIKSFEDDFRSVAGHAPRGGERVPLASTYRQYREWKRDIRDHAAAQIQALVRRGKRRAARYVPGSCASKTIRSRDDTHFEIARRRDAVAQLSKEKRIVKQQLKDYDSKFIKKHGRPPLKFEKEPIRDLYEKYHAIKARIDNLCPRRRA